LANNTILYMLLDKKSLIFYKRVLFVVSFAFCLIQINPHVVFAKQEVTLNYGRGPVELLFVNHPDNPVLPADELVDKIIDSSLPTTEEIEYYTTYITATAYTSRAAETDDSPFIAAWGDHVFWGMIASNAFPKGTKIQIPDYYGSKVFVVLDRMNARYYHHIDIWMPDLSAAKSWGSRYIKINILK